MLSDLAVAFLLGHHEWCLVIIITIVDISVTRNEKFNHIESTSLSRVAEHRGAITVWIAVVNVILELTFV